MDTTPLEKHAPLHERLLQILKEWIIQGEYPYRSEFPSERELAAEFDVSRATVRSAVASLVGSGLLIRRRGVGTFVGPLAQIANPVNEIIDFAKLIASGGFEPSVKIGKVLTVEADETLASALSIKTGSRLLQINKVFSADGEPLIYVKSSIPEWMVQDCIETVLQEPSITEPLFTFLEDHCCQSVKYMITRFWPDTLQDCPIDIDNFDPGTPVLMMDYVAYSEEGIALYHSLQAYIGGRIKFDLIRRRSE